MNWSASVVLILLLAGCLGARPESAQDGAPQPIAVVPDSAVAEPGLYELSLDGLVKVDAIPGLTWETTSGGTRYSFDVRETLRENSDVLLLVQAIDDQIASASFDIDIPLESTLGEGPGSEIICLGTALINGWNENGFYFERAAGRPGTPPSQGEGNETGGLIAHMFAGPIEVLVELYGDRFVAQSEMDFRIRPGGFLRFDNGLSQYPPDATRNDDSFWFQNFTMPAAHRVIQIPPSPLFCARGFAEFDGVQKVGKAPWEYAQGGSKAIDTTYGTSVVLNQEMPGTTNVPDANPLNQATVHFLDEVCVARAGFGVHRTSFEASHLEVELGRWQGHPVVILSGFARGEGPWTLFPREEACPQ